MKAKRLRHITVFLTLLTLISFSSFATTYETTKNGDWDSKSSWLNNSKPGSSISSNDIVYVKHNIDLDKNISVYGKLIIETSASLSGNKNITVKSNGILTVNSYLSVKNLDVHGSFINSGSIEIEDDFENHSTGTVTSSGTIYVVEDLHNDGTFTNSGSITVDEDLHNDGIFTNTGFITVLDKLDSHKETFTNNGNILVTEELKNSTTFTNNNVVSVVKEFINKESGLYLNNDSTIIYSSDEISENLGTIINDTNAVLIVKGMFNNIKDKGPGDIKNYGQFKLVCDTISCATFLDDGIVTMYQNSVSVAELFLKGGQWHYVSIPMTTMSSNVFWGGAIYSYNEENSSWKKHINDENLDVTIGYDVYFKNDVTIRFEGTFRNGEQTAEISKKGSSSKGFNLIANPYYACVDWNKKGWSKKNSENGIYIWDPKSQNIASYVNGVGTNGGTQFIAPMQAFFVKCDSTVGKVKSVKVHSNAATFRQEVVSDELLRLKVIAENGYSDETVIRFTNKSTVKFDPDYDADKMMGYNLSIPQLYTKSVEGTDLSINSLPEINEQISIPLYCKTRISSKSSIEINLENMDANVNVFLEDLKTESIHDMLTGAYVFNADVNDDENRFVIHFSKPGTIASGTTDLETESGEDEAGINIYTNKGSVIVDLQTNSNTQNSISVFSLNGKEVFYTQTTDSYNEFKLNLTIGYYIVKVENAENSYSRKVIIW